MREYHWTRVQSRVSGNFFSCFPFLLDPATLARAQRPATGSGGASRRFPPPRVAAETPIPHPQRSRWRDEPPRPSQPLQIGACARHRANQRAVTASALVTPSPTQPPGSVTRAAGPVASHPPSHPATRPGACVIRLALAFGSARARQPAPVASPEQATRGLQKFARAFAKSLATEFATRFANALSKSLLSPGSDGPAPRCCGAALVAAAQAKVHCCVTGAKILVRAARGLGGGCRPPGVG